MRGEDQPVVGGRVMYGGRGNQCLGEGGATEEWV